MASGYNENRSLHESLSSMNNVTAPYPEETDLETNPGTAATLLNSPRQGAATDKDREVAKLLRLILLRLDNLERFVINLDLLMSRLYITMENTNENLKRFSEGVMGLLRGWGLLPAGDIPLVGDDMVGAIESHSS
ncbi:hypothetical protein F5Y16DRAFT_389261 [Xylariaceae sp. FL0255]|nr:hypothetical protein F5Y16DRAFT_389261 [Xylariaceae sp. FL0255]